MNIKKRNSTIASYTNEIKTITDQLAATKSIISDDEIVVVTLVGLNVDFNSFDTYVRMHSPLVTSLQIHNLLL